MKEYNYHIETGYVKVKQQIHRQRCYHSAKQRVTTKEQQPQKRYSFDRRHGSKYVE